MIYIPKTKLIRTLWAVAQNYGEKRLRLEYAKILIIGKINRTKSLGMNLYPHEINLFWYGFNSFSVWMNIFHMGIFSFWYGMNSFTLPYINSGPGFPIVLVGTFNKSKYITQCPQLRYFFNVTT